MFKLKIFWPLFWGWHFFRLGSLLVIPFHFYEGGATGITLITYYLFKIPVSIMNLSDQYSLFVS